MEGGEVGKNTFSLVMSTKSVKISKVFQSKLESFVREIEVKMYKMIEKYLSIWYNGHNWVLYAQRR